MQSDKVNILLVDDQPGKLMSYEVILAELGENLLKASSATEALQILLKNDVAVLLVDVCMPDLDGFELAAMIREHPRFEKTAIIFISAVLLSEGDSLRGYELGGVDYVPVPVVPGVLRAKVRVFVDLFRKSKQLEKLNAELEERVAARTAALEASTRHQELLAREVDHRAKNALAVVQSIVRLTKANDVEAYSEAVHGRIRAIAGAHTLLSETRWIGADLMRLAREELAPYQHGDQVSITGPSVILRPAEAQAAAIILHELATNAVKYGALSAPQGRLAVSWTTNEDCIDILWEESGGPLVSKPTATGFGAKVIQASASQLNGQVDMDWRAHGLRCKLHIPRGESTLAIAPIGEPADKAGRDPIMHPSALQGLRVLLVEDEALIAMMMMDILSGHGAATVGPFSTLASALVCDQPFDVALLDINIGGESVHPLAEKLDRKGVPMIFVTGYDESAAPARFAKRILQKPIEPMALVEAVSFASAAA